MPRNLRLFLSLLGVGLGVPVLVASCAQGDPRAAEPVPQPTATQQPTEPVKPVPTQEKPTPTNPDEALPPVVTSVTPDKATVGSIGPSIVVVGDDFVPRSIVQLDGVPLATTFVSGTELRATLPTSKLATLGFLHLSVGTSAPGGGASEEVTFEVQNPTATLTSLAPLSVVINAGATTLSASGAGFVPGSRIVFGATGLTTTFVSSTSLTATIPASALVTPGSVPVTIVTPAPGGGTSTSIAFTVANPTATAQAVSPSVAVVGSASLPVTVTGAGFVAGSAVLFNGVALTTTFVSATELRASVPATSLGAAGDFPVTVSNPPPGGGITSPVVFRVQYPVAQPGALAPSSALAGAGPTDVVVSGVGFFPSSQVTFGGAPAATTFVDATHLKATLAAAQLAVADSIAVRVVNPVPGGGTSAALAFTVNNPAPAVASLNPGSVVSGSPDTAVTLTGTGFVPSSTVKSNNVLVMTTYVSATTLTAVVPASHLGNPGAVALTVTNPLPGGGTSAPRTLSVGCDPAGVDVALGALGSVTSLATSFAAAPSLSRFAASGSCATTSIDPSITQPGRFWVVQNTAGVPVTLSAWADCTASGKQDDAYLTFYRRPTRPANDAERLACAAEIAEGIAVTNFSSPESGASSWCPGLTKANGGGLPLAVCEKVVVHVQAYNAASATYPPPPTVRLKPE